MMLRRLILALALSAGLAPAFAQVPAPVPALPDTERRISYTISASLCACNVGFALYGDSTDYANWVEVYLNGVRQVGNWTVTSPSGSLATLPRPISDAVLTFTTPQTGTVQIVGARRPRRTSQFSENRGVPARDLNQALTDIVAQNRETWDRTNDVTGRALLARPGSVAGLLPLPTLCSSAFLGFASDGSTPVCLTGTGGGSVSLPVVSGNLACFSGVSGVLQDCGVAPTVFPQIFNFVTSPPYNAVCNGVTNDSAAIQAAINALPSYGGTVDIPPGRSCLISTALDFKGHNNVKFRGFGGQGAGNLTPAILLWNGTGARAMDFRDTNADAVIGMSIYNTNPSFTGYLIDAGATNPTVTISAYFQAKDLTIGSNYIGTPSGCINLSEAIIWQVDWVTFSRCGPAIHGQNILGQNTVGLISNSTFITYTGPAILQCGESWTLLHNTFEADVNGVGKAFQNALTLPCHGMTSIGNWYGDVITAGGQWWALTAFGFTAIGDKMTGTPGTSEGYGLNGGAGYSFEGGNYAFLSTFVSCFNNSTGIRVTGSSWPNGVTNLIGSSCLDATSENNTPTFSVALPTWTPVLTSTGGGSMPVTVNSALYKKRGNLAEFWFTATIGTSTGSVAVSVTGLPLSLSNDCVFSGFDTTTSRGLAGRGVQSTTNFNLFRADGTFPGTTGAVLNVYGSCQTN